METVVKKKLKINKANWTPVKFGDVVFEPKENAKDIYNEGIEHVVGLEHIDSENIHLIRSGKLEETTTFSKKFSKGDVLFGRRRAYLKKAALASFDGICSGDITVFRPKKNLLPELLPFIVNNDKFFDYAVKHSAGGLSPRVKFKDLANYEFLLPPKAQQAQLAELLWAMDEVIEKEKGVLKDVIIFYKSLQKELFNSKEYEESNIIEVASVKRGKFTPRPRNDPRYFGGNIPFIQTAEVIETTDYIKRFSQTLNEEGLAVSKMFQKETIVMVIAGTYVGSCALLSFDSAFTDSLLGIQANSAFLNQKYLFYFMQFYEKQIDSLATEVAQRNLSIDLFQHFKVRYPKSMALQIKIVKKIENVYEPILLCKNKISSSQALQKSLINQIF